MIFLILLRAVKRSLIISYSFQFDSGLLNLNKKNKNMAPGNESTANKYPTFRDDLVMSGYKYLNVILFDVSNLINIVYFEVAGR